MAWNHVYPGVSVSENRTKVRLNVRKLLRASRYDRREEGNLLTVRAVLREAFEAILGKDMARLALSSLMKGLAREKLTIGDTNVEIEIEGAAPGRKMGRQGGKRKLPLEIELVPQPCWGRSLHRLLPRREWETIRKAALERAGHQCEICGESAKLSCHELWHYDDRRRIQTLRGILVLCGLCNLVKHIGKSSDLAARGQLDYERVVAHFMAVNHASRDEFEAHKARAFEVWHDRSQEAWRTDFGRYARLLAARREG